MDIDFRRILRAYMTLVGENEGVDFLDDVPEHGLPGLTPIENATLLEIGAEGRVGNADDLRLKARAFRERAGGQ